MKLKELAQHLGLSQTTVSRALNGYPEVNEETRRRVLEAARRHGYQPNASARRLATGRAGAIGIVHADRPQHADRSPLHRIPGRPRRDADARRDRHRAVAVAGRRRDRHLSAASPWASGSMPSSCRVRLLADARIALLTDLRPALHPAWPHANCRSPHAWLDIDNEGAFRHATKHLLDLGHRRIGLINGEARFTFARDRERGFRAAMAGTRPRARRAVDCNGG